MIPDEMLDKNFRIKDKCKIICKLDFMVLSTNESNPKTIFYCENKLSIDMESSLRNALSEFGNYEIISIRESIGIDGISCAEFKTNLPYDFYRFVLSTYLQVNVFTKMKFYCKIEIKIMFICQRKYQI